MSHEIVDVVEQPVIVVEVAEAVGARGPKGDPGRDGVDGLPGRDGVDGQDGAPGRDGAPGVDGRDGADGLSAYEVAVAAGFVGSEVEWLASLVGPDGAPGRDGVDGQDGAPGRDGVDGQDGRDGVDGLPGEKGDKGDPGADGAPGVGVPTGGTVGQVLTKTGAGDYATGWADPTGGSLPSRQTTTIPAAAGAGSVELAPAFTILSVTYSGAARLRLYRTATGRDADAARPVTVVYPGRRGRIYEYVAEGAELDAEGSVAGSSASGATVCWQVDGGPVDIVIEWIRAEA